MISSKRKIETEQDRFGGFEETVSTEKNIFRTADAFDVRDSERVFSRTASKEPEILFSTRENTRTLATPEQNTIKRKTSLKEEDLMPSIKTMSYVEPKSQFDSREKMEGKTKLMLAIYMIVVVVLAAVVIGTGILINSLNSNINKLNMEITENNAVIEMQIAEIATLSDPYNIAGRAKDPNRLNMIEIDPSAVIEIELIPLAERNPAPVKMGRFERFCKWMQGILGSN